MTTSAQIEQHWAEIERELFMRRDMEVAYQLTLRHSLEVAERERQRRAAPKMSLDACRACVAPPRRFDAKKGACAICMDCEAPGQEGRRLFRQMPCCGGQMHYICVRKWLLKEGTCPLCRANFAPPAAPPPPPAAPTPAGDARAPPAHLRVLEASAVHAGPEVIVVTALGRRRQ